MLKRRSISALLSILLISSTSIGVFASPKSELQNDLNKQKQELNDAKNQMNSNKKKLEQAEEEMQDIEIKIEKLDCEIESLQNEMDITEGKITKLNKNIKETQERIKKIEKDMEEEKIAFGKRIRALYMSGNQSKIEILFSADDFNDFLTKAEVVKCITDYDQKLLADFKDNKNKLDKSKLELEEDKQQLVAYKDEQESRMAKFDDSKNEQVALLEKIDEKRKYYAATIPEYNDKVKRQQQMINETLAKLEALASESSGGSNKPSTPSRGNGQASSNEVVAYAKTFLGIPYEWGGNGPKTFDCSGYVRYVYAHFGIKITRTTYTQYKEGKYVARKDLKPGDLVFFGYGAPHHVGMYVGNNYYIHAPRTGDVIKISPLTRRDYHSARRFF